MNYLQMAEREIKPVQSLLRIKILGYSDDLRVVLAVQDDCCLQWQLHLLCVLKCN